MGTSYRIPWDAEEVAVLVHGYIQLKNSVLFYNEAIKYVSHTLRERALRRGMNVGETFRNENGISMQMTKIEDIFSGGKFRLSPPPQVFFDVVQLYRKDRKAFNELLERATGASSDRAALEKDFFQWLANKVPPHILPNLQDACHKLNKFLSEYKVLDISLFDKNIIHVMDKVKSTVNSNEILHFLQQEKMPLMQTAIEFYYIYLIEAHDNDASHQLIDSPHESQPSSPVALSPAHEQEASIHESAEIRPDTSSTTSATTLALADPAQEVYMQSYHIPLSRAALVLGVLHSGSIADAYAASRSDTERRMY